MNQLLMRDSDDPFAIPLDGLAAVAGYGDGDAQWSSAGWARFPASIVPLVVVLSAAHQGDILDVERGGAAPADCPGWADRFRRAGRRRPSIYCNRSTIAGVRQAMAGRPFDWWAATLDGTTAVPGAVAVQRCGAADSHDPCRTAGHYDESVILDPSWVGRTGGDDVDPTLASKLDALVNVLLTGGDNRVPNPAIFAVLAAIRGDDAGVLAAVQAQGARLTALEAELSTLKAEVEAGGSVDAAAVLSRIEKALQSA